MGSTNYLYFGQSDGIGVCGAAAYCTGWTVHGSAKFKDGTANSAGSGTAWNTVTVAAGSTVCTHGWICTPPKKYVWNGSAMGTSHWDVSINVVGGSNSLRWMRTAVCHISNTCRSRGTLYNDFVSGVGGLALPFGVHTHTFSIPPGQPGSTLVRGTDKLAVMIQVKNNSIVNINLSIIFNQLINTGYYHWSYFNRSKHGICQGQRGFA
jgi:hypothetical protein